MGVNLRELSLDLSRVNVPKAISDFLREVSTTRESSEKLLKLDNYIEQLEDELRKIDAFRRELPLCMLLLNDAILRLKEEAMQCTESEGRPVMEEFIPLKGNSNEDGGVEMGSDCSDKKNWMRTAQLWSTNTEYDSNKQSPILELQPRREEDGGSATENPFQPCKSRNRVTVLTEDEEIIPVPGGLSLVTPLGSSNMNSKSGGGGGGGAIPGSSLLTDQTKLHSKPQQQQQQALRKQRRCWSPELHRRFVNALQQLGGPQVATPKQIRELMQVDGLTNDEVKSHLQKYRLHVRRLPATSAAAAAANGLCMGQDQCGDHLSKANSSQSGSPQGPLHIAGSAKGISTTGGDSMEDEEDEKSEGHSWRGRIDKPGENDV